MRRRALEWLAGLSTGHPVAVVVAAVAVFAASAPFALRAARNIETDFTHLIPTDREVSPAGSFFVETLKLFGAADKLYIAVELDSPELVADGKAFVDELAAGLAAEKCVRRVSHRTNKETIDFIRDRIGERAYLFLEEQDLDALGRTLSTEGIRAQMKENGALVHQSMEAFRTALKFDPLGLRDIFEARLRRHGQEMGSVSADGYFLSKDRTVFGIVVKPAEACHDLSFSQHVIETVARAERAAHRSVASADPAAAERLEGRCRVHLAGGYASRAFGDAILKRDLGITFLISITGVMFIFAVSFRRIGAAPMAAVPLSLAIFVTLAVAGLRFNRISMMSGCFAAMLLGLGIDFAVHIYNRYVMERRRGRSPEESVTIAIVRTGGGVFLGGLTTAIAFFGIMVTSFRALSEIGFLAGWGIILSMIAMTTVLPAMLLLRARLGERAGHFRNLVGYGLGWLSRAIHRLPGTIVAVSVALAAAGVTYLALTMTTAFFDYDLWALGSPKDPSIRTRELIAEKFGMNLSELLVVASGRTEAEALDRSKALVERLQAGGPSGGIRAWRSVLGQLPAPSSQRAAVDFLRKVDLDRVGADVRRFAVSEAGLSERGAEIMLVDFADWLGKVKGSLEGPGPDLIASADFEGTAAQDLLDHYIARDGELVYTATYLNPEPGSHSRAWYKDLAARLGCGEPPPASNLSMTAPVLAAYELRDMVYGDFTLITGSVLAGVILALLLLFRGACKALVALAPMAAGLVFTLSVMMLIGHRLNYVNVVILPMIIGVGIDYGIHVLHRFVHGARVEQIVMETGRAIVVTTLTTMAGFGALMAADMRGIASLGFVASLGAAMCLVASIVALPAALVRFFPHWRGCEEPECGCGELEDGECPVIWEVRSAMQKKD